MQLVSYMILHETFCIRKRTQCNFRGGEIDANFNSSILRRKSPLCKYSFGKWDRQMQFEGSKSIFLQVIYVDSFRPNRYFLYTLV